MSSKSAFNKNKKMIYQNLGSTGLQVSKFSYGCMTFSNGRGFLSSTVMQADAAFAMMSLCYTNGINFFDNAESYGGGGDSEVIMGQAIQMGIARGVWQRMDLIISTKIFFGGRDMAIESHNTQGLSRKHIVEGLRASLKRMQVEYVDLVFCHRPDTKVSIEETVRAMNWVIDQGLAFYWGTSEWSAAQLQEASGIANRLGMIPPQFDQCEYSLVKRNKVEIEYAPLYPALGTTVWSPLAGGALSGKYSSASADQASKKDRYGNVPTMLKSDNKRVQNLGKNLDAKLQQTVKIAEALRPIAAELGCTLAALALAWCVVNPHVSTVIVGATKIEQMEENFKALDVVPKLTAAVMKRIDDIAGTKPRLDEIMQQIVDIRGPPPHSFAKM